MTTIKTRVGRAALTATAVSYLALTAGMAWAAGGAGSLDATFGAGEDDGTPAGIVSTSLGSGDDVANDLAVGADGKVLVVGNRFNGQSNDIVLVRYTKEGLFDAGFGVGDEDGTPDGVVNISLGDGDDFGTALAVQPDGKVVVAGYHEEGKSTNIVVLRVNADGTLDQGFGTADDGTPNGIVNISLGDGDDVARDVAVQPDGKIVVVGDSVSPDGSTNIVLARLNADGSADQGFGAGSEDGTPSGFVSTSLGKGNDYANSVALQADGKIVVAGHHQAGKSTNIAVARYDAKGELDQGFGTADDGTPNGIVNLSLGEGDDVATGVAVQGDKLLVVAGTTTATDGSKNIAVLRLTAR
jgi:uncharacterized delta-60 repeat protein